MYESEYKTKNFMRTKDFIDAAVSNYDWVHILELLRNRRKVCAKKQRGRTDGVKGRFLRRAAVSNRYGNGGCV